MRLPAVALSGVEGRRMKSAIAELAGRCDVCLVDLDQCIYPIFTQTVLGALLLLRALSPSRWHCLPRLLSGAIYITRTRLGQIAGGRPSNYELMDAFCRVIRGFPSAWVETSAGIIPRLGPRSWRDALGRISGRMPVYLLSFAIEPIVSAFGREKDPSGRKIFAAAWGTPLISIRGVIEGCGCTLFSLSPATKLRKMERICAEGKFARPLVIGHGEDESLIAVRAREMGGGSIGIVRPRQPFDSFDIALRGHAWRTISRSLRQ
jgi:hypothetical protein